MGVRETTTRGESPALVPLTIRSNQKQSEAIREPLPRASHQRAERRDGASARDGQLVLEIPH